MAWVEVAQGWGVAQEVGILVAMLADAGIPCELSYRPFSEMMGWPLGALSPSRVLVPPEYAEPARDLLSAEPDAPWREEAGRELDEMSTWPRGTARTMIGYAFVGSLRLDPVSVLASIVFLVRRYGAGT